MLIFSLSFLLGIAQLLWLPNLHHEWLLGPTALLLISLTLRYRVTKTRIPKSAIIQFISINIGVSLGFAFAIIISLGAKSHQLQIVPKEPVTVEGEVIGLPIIKHDKVKFTLKITKKVDGFKFRKILVSWYKNTSKVKAGQVWRFKLKVKPIHGFNNPGSFDYAKWLFRHGYDATATVKHSELIKPDNEKILTKITILRTYFRTIIDENFKSERIASLLKALTIGDKSQISFADSQLFQQTGTAHLIAISGLHIGLMAFVGVLFGRLLFFLISLQRINRFKFEAIFAISFALIYALLAGFSTPTIRALIMVVVFSLSYAFKFKVTRWQSWSIALLLVLIFDALSVLDAGFWFSFGAVSVLMFAFSGRKPSTNKIIAFVKAQGVILIGLMPLMVIVFQQLNLLTPFVNIVVLPLASILLIPLLFASLFMYFISEEIADFLFFIVEYIANTLFVLLDYFKAFDFLIFTISPINKIMIASIVVISIVLLLPRLFRWKWLLLFIVVPLSLMKQIKPQTNEFKVNVLDVGQGLSVVVTTQNKVLIYDTGAKFKSGFSMANAVVLPFLHTLGIKHVDKLILSHEDNDHSGGKQDIIEEFEGINVMGVMGKYQTCQYPKSWNWDGVVFEVLSPYELIPYFGNNSSCVIKVSSQYGSILLTADIEDAVEYRLLSQFKEKIESDVLIVPHHGSKTSSNLEFIKQVAPQYAINSSGFANQFNHPHPLIKQRYQEAGIDFFDTQIHGMLQVDFVTEGVLVDAYKDNNQHFWQINTQ